MNFAVSYNQRDSQQTLELDIPNAGYFNFGENWTCNWLSYVNTSGLDAGYVEIYAPGGGSDQFTNYSAGSFAPQSMTGANLTMVNATNYVETMPSGSQLVFGQSDGNGNVFLTAKIDAQGNTNRLVYATASNNVVQLSYIVDSLGQVTSLSYGLATDSNKVTQVTDPFGRSAFFQYDVSNRLVAITDTIGITSQFTYDDTDNNPTFINSLTTPYGTTTFIDEDFGFNGQFWYGNNYGIGTLGLEAVDPLGQHERWEMDLVSPDSAIETNPAVPNITVDDGQRGDRGLNVANTVYWNKAAYAASQAEGLGLNQQYWDYSKAYIYHWFSDLYNDGQTTGILDSEKPPLENRIWYTYPGQNPSTPWSLSGVAILHPSGIARVLDDGTTQLYSNEYNNAFGKVIKTIDPVGRVISNVYAANGIDLLQVHQTTGTNNDLLATYIYNSQHLVITNIDASGQGTTYTYDPYGKVLTRIDPLGETTSYVYSNEYLIATIDATGTTNMTYTYDLLGRVRTTTDSQGYTVTTDYDNANRPTVYSYPDGTYQQLVYNNLDLAATRDRLGRWTRKFYDPLRRVVAVIDPLWRTTQFQYCVCGALENLIDPLGHTTSWSHDLEGRVTAKTYADNTSVQYVYENTTSRLKQMTDAKGQSTIYTNNLDNTLAQVSYSNAVVATAPVSFTYDTNYNRVVTMVDTNGTTTYTYNPNTNTVLGAGNLASITVPLSNSTVATTYGYDQLGRLTVRAINNVTNSVTYDNLGRVMIVSNVLGVFSNKYVGVTARLSTMSYPNGQLLTNTYFGNTGDERLQEILNQASGGSTVSKFDYTYDSEGEIQSWTQQTIRRRRVCTISSTTRPASWSRLCKAGRR